MQALYMQDEVHFSVRPGLHLGFTVRFLCQKVCLSRPSGTRTYEFGTYIKSLFNSEEKSRTDLKACLDFLNIPGQSEKRHPVPQLTQLWKQCNSYRLNLTFITKIQSIS